MSHEKPVDRAVEDDNLEFLVGFHCCNRLVELWNSVRAKDVERLVINRKLANTQATVASEEFVPRSYVFVF